MRVPVGALFPRERNFTSIAYRYSLVDRGTGKRTLAKYMSQRVAKFDYEPLPTRKGPTWWVMAHLLHIMVHVSSITKALPVESTGFKAFVLGV